MIVVAREGRKPKSPVSRRRSAGSLSQWGVMEGSIRIASGDLVYLGS